MLTLQNMALIYATFFLKLYNGIAIIKFPLQVLDLVDFSLTTCYILKLIHPSCVLTCLCVV
jgi:hypothetical protein